MTSPTKNSAPQTSREAQIREQAKSIMDNFFTALKSANVNEQKIGVKRSQQTRKPASKQSDDSFRRGMFANAPNKDIDYIVAEKKHW